MKRSSAVDRVIREATPTHSDDRCGHVQAPFEPPHHYRETGELCDTPWLNRTYVLFCSRGAQGSQAGQPGARGCVAFTDQGLGSMEAALIDTVIESLQGCVG